MTAFRFRYVACCFVTAAFCQAPVPIAAPANNTELMGIMIDDQHDRGNEPFVTYDAQGKRTTPEKVWTALSQNALLKRDAERRARVRALLDAGRVKTAKDYEWAALVYQHGDTPADVLLAHVLAVTAVSKGDRSGLWLAAATLDRYLHKTGADQVFGTQFARNQDGSWGKGKYAKDLVTDTMRADWCVVPYAMQQKMAAAAQFNTGLQPCQ